MIDMEKEIKDFFRYVSIICIIIIAVCIIKGVIRPVIATPLILLCALLIPKKKEDKNKE